MLKIEIKFIKKKKKKPFSDLRALHISKILRYVPLFNFNPEWEYSKCNH